jgi:hypothetical protein
MARRYVVESIHGALQKVQSSVSQSQPVHLVHNVKGSRWHEEYFYIILMVKFRVLYLGDIVVTVYCTSSICRILIMQTFVIVPSQVKYTIGYFFFGGGNEFHVM